MPVFPSSQVLSAGAYYLGVAEREDGTMLRQVTMAMGYPTCTFGEPAPTSGELAASILALETTTNNRVSVLQGNLTSAVARITTQLSSAQSSIEALSAQLSTSNAQLAAMSSQTAASLSSQVASLRDEIQTGADRLDNIESRMSQQVAGIPEFTVDDRSVARPGPPAISAVASDINILASGSNGKVKVSSSGCHNIDLCELAQSVTAIVDTLRVGG